MGDPGLCPGDPPGLAIADGAGAQAAQVGAGLRLGEHCGGNDRARRDARQEAGLLVGGPVRQNQLGGDLRAGAQRTGPDPAAGERLGDHAHGHLAEACAAPGFRRGQAEDSQVAQFLQQFEGDEFVAQVPTVGERCDLPLGEGVKLVADRLQRLVQAAGFQRGPAARRVQQFDDAGLYRLRGAGCQPMDHRCEPVCLQVGVSGAKHLALVHRQAARQLTEILVRQQLRRQGLGLAELSRVRQPPRPIRGLAQSLGVGCHPGQAVGDVLLAIQGGPVQTPVKADPRSHRTRQRGAQGLTLGGGEIEEVNEVRQDQAHGFLY